MRAALDACRGREMRVLGARAQDDDGKVIAQLMITFEWSEVRLRPPRLRPPRLRPPCARELFPGTSPNACGRPLVTTHGPQRAPTDGPAPTNGTYQWSASSNSSTFACWAAFPKLRAVRARMRCVRACRVEWRLTRRMQWRAADIWWIQSVYVHPDHRKKGLFRALYLHAKARSREAGACGVRLYVDDGNVKATDTYRCTPARACARARAALTSCDQHDEADAERTQSLASATGCRHWLRLSNSDWGSCSSRRQLHVTPRLRAQLARHDVPLPCLRGHEHVVLSPWRQRSFVAPPRWCSAWGVSATTRDSPLRSTWTRTWADSLKASGPDHVPGESVELHRRPRCARGAEGIARYRQTCIDLCCAASGRCEATAAHLPG